MAIDFGAIEFYVLFALLPLGLAVYLLARAKRRVEYYIIGVILLIIATVASSASVDSFPARHLR